MKKSITVGWDQKGRIDKFLSSEFSDWSRSYIQRLINDRHILVDGHPVSPNHQLKNNQKISIVVPKKKAVFFSDPKAPLPFPVIFEDEHLMVINKPAGLLCHPAGWKRMGDTLVELLMGRLKSEEWADDLRPGLVHRLDRDTSGVILFAKTPEAHASLSKQFARREVKKVYQAIAIGGMTSKQGTFECNMARHPGERQKFTVTQEGRLAITKFLVLEKFGKLATLVELYPLTGRTHQLRVQLSSFGHPILGDRVYADVKPTELKAPRQMLHAKKLTFVHPTTKKKMEFDSDLPDDFLVTLKLIRSAYDNAKK